MAKIEFARKFRSLPNLQKVPETEGLARVIPIQLHAKRLHSKFPKGPIPALSLLIIAIASPGAGKPRNRPPEKSSILSDTNNFIRALHGQYLVSWGHSRTEFHPRSPPETTKASSLYPVYPDTVHHTTTTSTRSTMGYVDCQARLAN
jgi:hypothetical protein